MNAYVMVLVALVLSSVALGVYLAWRDRPVNRAKRDWNHLINNISEAVYTEVITDVEFRMWKDFAKWRRVKIEECSLDYKPSGSTLFAWYMRYVRSQLMLQGCAVEQWNHPPIGFFRNLNNTLADVGTNECFSKQIVKLFRDLKIGTT